MTGSSVTRSAGAGTAEATGRSGGHVTTSGVIALVNLRAQIDGQWERFVMGRLSAAQTAELIELIALRGRLLGRISDYEAAERCADWLCEAHPDDGTARLARACCRARFHRFQEALDDLDHAERLGADQADVAAERVAVLMALGRFDDAAAALNSSGSRRSEFEFLASLASLAAARGRPGAAEKLFDRASRRYRGVSPIPLADLEHERGRMWLSHRDVERSWAWLQAAHQRMPDNAPAQGHLAQAEALRGRTDVAVQLLQPLAEHTEDPIFAATLARVLSAAGRPTEAARWRDSARRRYKALVADHPEAFAHHSA